MWAARAKAASGVRADAVEAREALKYTRREAERVVGEVLLERPEVDSLEALLRLVLEQQAPAR